MESVKRSHLDGETDIRKQIISKLTEAKALATRIGDSEVEYFINMAAISVMDSQSDAMSNASPGELKIVISNVCSKKSNNVARLAFVERCLKSIDNKSSKKEQTVND